MQPNVPVIPPAQTYFVLTVVGLIVLAFVCMLILKASVFLAERRTGVEYHWEAPTPREKGPMRQRIESWAAEIETRYTPRRYSIMSHEDESELVRAEIEPVREGGSAGSGDPVRAHQNQLEPVEPANSEPVREPLILHNLSRAALIAVLAVQRSDSGGYRFSKNQIAAFVGGTKADILKEIDLYREKPAAPRPPTRAERPADGWLN